MLWALDGFDVKAHSQWRMKPAPLSTTPEERRKVLDDLHDDLLMTLFVGAAGSRQLLDAKPDAGGSFSS